VLEAVLLLWATWGTAAASLLLIQAEAVHHQLAPEQLLLVVVLLLLLLPTLLLPRLLSSSCDGAPVPGRCVTCCGRWCVSPQATTATKPGPTRTTV